LTITSVECSTTNSSIGFSQNGRRGLTNRLESTMGMYTLGNFTTGGGAVVGPTVVVVPDSESLPVVLQPTKKIADKNVYDALMLKLGRKCVSYSNQPSKINHSSNTYIGKKEIHESIV
jgi:hypothetical protein